MARPWQSQFVEVNGIRLHYWRTGAGSGKPVMVLLHGVTDNGACWASFAVGMLDDYDVIFYDARGHGRSGKPGNGYRLKDHEKDLIGLLEALGIEHPILMGHSMGGGIIARYAADFPDAPRAVILEDPAFFPKVTAFDDVMAGLRGWLVSLGSRIRNIFVRTESGESPQWNSMERRAWLESKIQFTPRLIETLRDLPDVASLLPKITAPTLILKADAPEEERREHLALAAALPNGRLLHIDGAGHRVHRDKLAETTAAVREFLRGEGLP